MNGIAPDDRDIARASFLDPGRRSGSGANTAIADVEEEADATPIAATVGAYVIDLVSTRYRPDLRSQSAANGRTLSEP
jgi:hypothetical protein